MGKSHGQLTCLNDPSSISGLRNWGLVNRSPSRAVEYVGVDRFHFLGSEEGAQVEVILTREKRKEKTRTCGI